MTAANIVSRWEMLKFQGDKYHKAMASLNRALVICGSLEEKPPASKKTDVVTPGVRKIMRELLERVQSSISDLRLEITAMSVTETLKEVDDDESLTFGELEARLGVVDVTARRELSTTGLYQISRDNLKYMAGSEPCFGPDVDLKFASASGDISEAGSCLALGRHTACVFHLMRVMEHGLRAVNLCLGLSDPTGGARNWKVLLDSVNDEITRRSQNGHAGWENRDDKALFVQLHGSLDAVRSAWRNATMHIERSYNEEEAEHALLMVRAFMKQLAVRCDEEGQPKA